MSLGKRCLACLLWLGFLISLSSIVDAGIGFDYSLLGGTNSNLLSDSSSIYDAYTTSRLNLKLYPFSILEVSITGEDTYYREFIGLSTSMGGLGLVLIPIHQASPFSLYLSAKVSGRLYHQAFKGFNNNVMDLMAAAGYQVSPQLTVRSGVSFKSTRYVNAEVSYKRDLDLFTGALVSFWGSNTLDMEAGISRTNYTHKDNIYFIDSMPPIINFPFPWPYDGWFLAWVKEAESNLWMFYYSPRWSRPIGSKTGISFGYTRRLFQNYDDALLTGDTTASFLSPWASVWEGNSTSVGLKSYLIPKFIVSIGAGYWDKKFLKKVEPKDMPLGLYVDAKRRDARHDWQTKGYLTVQWPMKLQRGPLLEPILNVEYTNNVSNSGVYNYSGFAAMVGIRITL